jgi:hypothetical protein
MDASYYGNRVERTLNKFPSRGEGGTPSKYTIGGVCISFEKKKIHPFKENLGFH